MAEVEQAYEVTASELAKALEQWEADAEVNGWKARVDPERFRDGADYLIHTIRLARGEGEPKPKEG